MTKGDNSMIRGKVVYADCDKIVVSNVHGTLQLTMKSKLHDLSHFSNADVKVTVEEV